MKTFEVTITGSKELSRALNGYPQIAKPIVQRAVVAVHAILAKHTLKQNPVPWRTGSLLHSFRFQSGAGWARWYPTAYYAQMVEEGTRPHRIYPRNKKVLSWSTGSAGRYVTSSSGRRRYQSGIVGRAFAQYVDHPGTKPHPFMQQILDNSRADIEKMFSQATQKILAEISSRV